MAAEFRIILGSLLRRLRQHRATDDPSAPETAVLARLEREGPATAAQLARRENVSPQSMGVTVSGLQDARDRRGDGQVRDDAEIAQLRDVMPLLDRLADAL
ncbi:hypothetical protein ND991_19335 [Gordonia sputi]|uniref:hypothetical protein n=1 Tax=Gordonia sputi TaxID=36823 RepID=UPI002042E77D|nr:hypothetical protein [Gordonia sputi]MCM3897363.1 hypothetical protein [Gordonia sputi]